MPDELSIDPARIIPAEALEVRTARASGPGGQHVNRTESKVHLRFDPRLVSWLDERARTRLYTLAGRSVDSEGRILIVSQEQRDQGQNLDRAREKLATLIRAALVRPKLRIATKPTRGSKERRIEGKKRRSDTKAGRGKVRDE
jgi:ribosome-associated protein